MSKIIAPTVGSQVWFQGTPTDSWNRNPDLKPYVSPGQPMAATVVAVWNDRMVNLDVIDHVGVHWFMSSVTLVQPGDTRPTNGHYAEWMPYQVGQANKEVSLPDAVEALKKAIQADPDLAWGWHCNVAMPILDAIGVTHAQANLASARVMNHLFDVDMTKHEHFAATIHSNDDTLPAIEFPTAHMQTIAGTTGSEENVQVEPLNLCDSCETAAHCIKSGCVPIEFSTREGFGTLVVTNTPDEPADVGTVEASAV